MPTLVLVDGSSYLYRAFHALPDLRTSRGEPTGALRGVISMLRRMAEDGKPEYFAVVFDAPGKTFRDDLYADYKATRTAMPDDLGAQIVPIHEMVRAHGWPLLMIQGVEADDVIGTLVKQATAQGIECIVSTSDKDLAQLVGPRVTLVNTMTNEKLDEAGVIAKFGVRADQVLDLLALTGDSVDNIPGVPKVGPKTAAKWLNQYGSLDAIVASAAEISGVVGESLRGTLEWLPQGKRLLTVKCDCELTITPTDLAIAAPDIPTLKLLYDRFEFKQWSRDLPGETETSGRTSDVTKDARLADGKSMVTMDIDFTPDAARSAALESAGDTVAMLADRDGRVDMSQAALGDRSAPSPPAEVARDYEMVLDRDAFGRWADTIENAELVSFDIEADTLDPMSARIVGLAFAIEPGRACYMPFAHRYPGAPDQLSEHAALERLAPWFADEAKKVSHNAKYVAHVLANRGLALAGVADDTLLQSYVIEPHKPHDMDNLAGRHLDLKTITLADIAGRGAGRIGFEEVSVEQATMYAAEAADVTLQLHCSLYPRLAEDPKLHYIYATIELPVREVLFKMERAGVLVDSALLAAQGRELGERVVTLEREAYQLAGQPFNLGSPKQLGEILFDKMKLPVLKKTATGQPSTDEEVLQELAANYPLPKLLLEHRALSKLKSTYTDKLPQMVDRRTGRVHTCYSQATAVTGRLASLEPNLQNIPVRTTEGRRIREAFIARPGSVLLSADYSQVELRIMAHLSRDPALLKTFGEGGDIHRATAAEIFSVALADVTSEQRRYIKAVNFGLIYGMSAFGLATQLSIARGAAQQFIDRYFARYPGVAEYMRQTRELARAQGYVETVFGRRLWLPDIKAASGPRRAGAERAAINAPMQGTAADIIKLAMVSVQDWIEREGLETRLIMQVHDELVLEVPDTELGRVRTELPQLMVDVARLSVPLVVDIGVGRNWEQAH